MKRCSIKDLISDPSAIAELEHDIEAGSAVIVPTDTLYGIAVSAKNPAAVKKVYDIKHRSPKKPLILFIPDIEKLSSLGFNVSDTIMKTIAPHWPGALTAILPKPDNAALKAFEFDSIGVRIPAHKALIELMQKLSCFLLTTSANRSGVEPCSDPDFLEKEFDGEIGWLIEDGILSPSLPSTVADFSQFPPKILRQGSVDIFSKS